MRRKAYLAAVQGFEFSGGALTAAHVPFDIEVILDGRTDAAVRYRFEAQHGGQVFAAGSLMLAYQEVCP